MRRKISEFPRRSKETNKSRGKRIAVIQEDDDDVSPMVLKFKTPQSNIFWTVRVY